MKLEAELADWQFFWAGGQWWVRRYGRYFEQQPVVWPLAEWRRLHG